MFLLSFLVILILIVVCGLWFVVCGVWFVVCVCFVCVLLTRFSTHVYVHKRTTPTCNTFFQKKLAKQAAMHSTWRRGTVPPARSANPHWFSNVRWNHSPPHLHLAQLPEIQVPER